MNEEMFTVVCKSCGHTALDPFKRGRQKYIQRKCKKCGFILPHKRQERVPFQDK